MPTRSDIFFFSSRRRHTRWPRDWSSDVCSSDLAREKEQQEKARMRGEKRNRNKPKDEPIKMREFDLNEPTERQVISGDESLDSMLQNQFKRVKQEAPQAEEGEQEEGGQIAKQTKQTNVDDLIKRREKM